MGGVESRNAAYQAVVCLFSNGEHKEIEKTYATISKGSVKKGFQSQDLKVLFKIWLQFMTSKKKVPFCYFSYRILLIFRHKLMSDRIYFFLH